MAPDAPLNYGQLSTWRSMQTFAADRLMEVNVPAVWDLSGLSLAAVSAALRRLTARHESLRTTYHLAGGQPVQRVHDEVTPRVEIIEQAGRGPADRASIARELHSRPFPVTGDLGWHAIVATSGGKPSFLALSLSHMVVDVWAARDLETRFRALASGAGDEQPGEPAPRELALLQRSEAWLTRRRGAEKYWRRVLAAGPVSNLPDASGRPRQQRIQATLGSHRLAALAAHAAKTHGVSPQSVLTAATAVALAQLVQRDRVMLSLMCANRFDPRWQPMIGTLNQLIPWVSEVDGQATVASYLKRAHLGALLAYRHGSYDVDMAAGLAAETRPPDGTGFVHDCWFNYVAENGGGRGDADGPEPPADFAWTPPARQAGHPFYLRVNGDGRTWASLFLRVDPDLVPAAAVVRTFRVLASFVLLAATSPERTLGSVATAAGAALPAELFPPRVEEPPALLRAG